MATVAKRRAKSLGPLAAATPAEALAREQMTLDEHFRRDHFPPPTDVVPASWRIEVGGLVRRRLSIGVDELLALAPRRSERAVLECAGHRRDEQRPAVSGLSWGVGAIGELEWTGVPLAAVLRRAGVRAGATAVALAGADAGEVPTGRHERYVRALPIDKALAPETLLATHVGGEPIPSPRGGPVRAIVPGWYATDAVKWLTTITVVDAPIDGYYEAVDYRFAPLEDTGPGERMTTMGVHAIVLTPAESDACAAGETAIGGIAWGGDGVSGVDVRVDGGAWRPARLGPDRGRWARRFWEARAVLAPGPHRIECRAHDAAGAVSPQRLEPNRGGYANHSVHGVDVEAV